MYRTKIRRKGETRKLSASSLRMVLFGCVLLVIVVYVFFFLSVIGNSETSPDQPKNAFASAHFRGGKDNKPLVIPENHEEHDQMAVEKLGKEQKNEIAPKAVAEEKDDSSSSSNNNNNNSGTKKKMEGVTTIGFAVTITGCGSDPITEGAAVLKHSIHLASVHGNLNGAYDYQMYAIYHPIAIKCAQTLESLGYKLVERDTPVAVKDIKGDFLRSKIEQNGCCGEKELVKLEAYTLTQHPIVVHLDLDTLILQPLDSLFDWMLAEDPQTFDHSHITVQWPEADIPKKINAFFTRDYNMGFGRKIKPVQGGFLVLRPDMDVYNQYVEIIREGDFQQDKGWGGVTGVFYGSMTFQGIIPYFYDVLHPGEAVEVNHCVYNQMADNPRNKRTVNDIVHGKCMTGEEECEDCRSRPLEEVITAHFTLCQKPWMCLPQDDNVIQQRLCRKLHHQWYRIRSDLEASWGRGSGTGEGDYQKDHFYGHCKSHSKRGYIYIKEPFGQP